MQISIEAIIGIIAVGAGAFFFLKPKDNNKKINELEQQKAQKQGQLDANKAERETLKDKIVAEQKDATEEQKQQFWKDYVKKDDK